MAEEKNEGGSLLPVDYKEFNLAPAQAEAVEKAFLPKKIEHEGYMEVYKLLLTKEISPETCEDARVLRLNLVKVRTGYEAIRKAEKDFYLNGGRFVDAIAKKKILGVSQMEEVLQKLEDHYAEIEKKRLDKLELARLDLLSEFPDFKKEIYDLRTMAGPDFNQLLQDQRDLKAMREQREAREAAEAEEAGKWKTLNDQRRDQTVNLANFIPGWDNMPFADLNDEQYQDLVNEATAAHQEDQQAKEKLRLENDRLKAEQEAKDQEEARREQVRKEQTALQDKRLNEILKVNDAQSNKIDLTKLWELKDEDYNRILANKTEAFKKRQADQAKAEADRKKLEKELADKKAAEEAAEKKKAEEEAAAKAAAEEEAKAPRKARLIGIVDNVNLFPPSDLKEDEVYILIEQKFEAFKKWARAEINKI